MTDKARLVLEDCKKVLSRFKNDAWYIDHHLNWVLAIVLLRTVGHVLDKVDSRRDPKIKKAVAELWKQLNRTPNSILKSEGLVFCLFLL